MEFDISEVKEEFISEMHENFIDGIFGDSSRLERKIWIKKICSDESWILDSL
jgi:hypothetical protein